MKTLPTESESIRDWSLVAAVVLRGGYRGATESESEAICIGLRGYSDKASVAACRKLYPKGRYSRTDGEE